MPNGDGGFAVFGIEASMNQLDQRLGAGLHAGELIGRDMTGDQRGSASELLSGGGGRQQADKEGCEGVQTDHILLSLGIAAPWEIGS